MNYLVVLGLRLLMLKPDSDHMALGMEIVSPRKTELV